MHPELIGWLEYLGIDAPELVSVKGVCGCRRFYRIRNHIEDRFMAMDASSCPESIPQIIGIYLRLQEAKVRVPTVRSFELHKGFMLIEDAGSVHLDDIRDKRRRRVFYEECIDILCRMQNAPTDMMATWQKIDVMQRLQGVIEDYIKGYKRVMMGCAETKVCLDAFERIADELMRQPQGSFVHGCFDGRACKIVDEQIVVTRYQNAQIGGGLYDFATLFGYLRYEDEAFYTHVLNRFVASSKIKEDEARLQRWVDFSLIDYELRNIASYARCLRDAQETKPVTEALNDSLERLVRVAMPYEELKAFCRYVTDPSKRQGLQCTTG